MNTDVARSIIYNAWKQRQERVLDASGWHRCTSACEMTKLEAYACIDGNHAIATPKCPDHPHSKPVLVNDMYVCNKTGKPHACNGGPQCVLEQGTCTVTGQQVQCVAAKQNEHAGGAATRCRRRRSFVYDNKQAACALMYDLLFSARRVGYEEARYKSYLDICRRVTQRYVRDCFRKNRPIVMQRVIEIYLENKTKLRPMTYVKKFDTQIKRMELCKTYAQKIVNLWSILGNHVCVTSTFDSVASAIVYMMRRGVAYDGIFVVPNDIFLLECLPDAHAIKEVGVHRRTFTQVKNTIARTIREIIDNGTVTATQLADCYDRNNE